MDPALIIFAIEAVIRLGRKLSEVLVDDVHERPLLLPLGDLHANVGEVNAIEFFDRPENRHLVMEGGPYFGFDRAQKAKAHATLIVLDERLGGRGDALADATETVVALQRFEQLKEGFGANSPLQRVLGTIIEIGIDYFAANPDALGKESNGRKVLVAFVSRLDDVEFAEGTRHEIVGDVLVAALHVLNDNVALVGDDQRLQVLLGGVTTAVIEEIEAGDSEAEKVRREDLFKRIGRSVIRGGATTFSENTDLFLPTDGAAKSLVESALAQTLAGLRDHEDLFTAEAVEVIFDNALRAVGENAQLFSDEKILQELIEQTTQVLADEEVENILSRETASSILAIGLEVTAENAETLIDTSKPQKQLLASTVAALAQGLSNELAGGARFRELLSRRQLVELASITFEEVARHPEQLLGDSLDEPRRTALAQVIGSVAAALGDDPKQLLNGEGVLELVPTALRVSLRNADKLLDLDSEDPETNLLFRITREMAEAALEADDPRKLISREVFLEMVERALPVVSANVGPLLGEGQPLVKQVVTTALDLASGPLENRTNGENLPALVQQLLTDVLRDELNLAQPDNALARATEILNTA